MQALADHGVLDDTLVIVSADHGENQGELNVYGDHQTADFVTCRVPLVVAGPGIRQGAVDHGLHYHLDLAPTVCALVGAQPVPEWSGASFAEALRQGQDCGRSHLVISQGAWSCQRAVRFGPWLLVRTYDPGLKAFPPLMLFHVEDDPHETRNLAEERPQVVQQGLALLEEWLSTQMRLSPSGVDPMWTVLREGGPFHTRGMLARYCERLRATGRGHHAERLLATGGRGW